MTSEFSTWISRGRSPVINALQRLRSFVTDHCAGGLNWIDDRILFPALDIDLEAGCCYPIKPLQERIGHLLHALVAWLFGFAYDGSDEELFSAFEGEVPRRMWNARQRAFVKQHGQSEMGAEAESFSQILDHCSVHCDECGWKDFPELAPDYRCPCCGTFVRYAEDCAAGPIARDTFGNQVLLTGGAA